MRSIDYSALEMPLSEADMVAYKQQYGGSWLPTSPRPGWTLLSVAGAAVLTAIVYANTWLMVLSIVVAMAAGVAGVVALVYLDVTQRRTRMARFAAQNGATFVKDQENPSLPGLIFDEGNDRVLRESITFSDGTVLGAHEFTTGSGKNRTVNRWGFVSVKLSRKLPNMVLDSEKNNFFGVISNLPDTFAKDQKLSLEGDFDKYFSLYAPRQYETDALYIFTPDVMQAAIDHGGGYDMEVVDDTFYVYIQIGADLSKAETIKNLLDIVSKVGTEIEHQGDYYSDERVGDRSLNMVAAPGQRLRGGFSWLIVVLVVFYAVGMLMQLLGATTFIQP